MGRQGFSPLNLAFLWPLNRMLLRAELPSFEKTDCDGVAGNVTVELQTVCKIIRLNTSMFNNLIPTLKYILHI